MNWFRKDDDGKFLWPGYGENMRVLAWVLARADGTAGAAETLLGFVPRAGDLDTTGLDLTPDQVEDGDEHRPRRMGTGTRIAG